MAYSSVLTFLIIVSFSVWVLVWETAKSHRKLHQESIEFDGPQEFCAWPRKPEQFDHLRRMGETIIMMKMTNDLLIILIDMLPS